MALPVAAGAVLTGWALNETGAGRAAVEYAEEIPLRADQEERIGTLEDGTLTEDAIAATEEYLIDSLTTTVDTYQEAYRIDRNASSANATPFSFPNQARADRWPSPIRRFGPRTSPPEFVFAGPRGERAPPFGYGSDGATIQRELPIIARNSAIFHSLTADEQSYVLSLQVTREATDTSLDPQQSVGSGAGSRFANSEEAVPSSAALAAVCEERMQAILQQRELGTEEATGYGALNGNLDLTNESRAEYRDVKRATDFFRWFYYEYYIRTGKTSALSTTEEDEIVRIARLPDWVDLIVRRRKREVALALDEEMIDRERETDGEANLFEEGEYTEDGRAFGAERAQREARQQFAGGQPEAEELARLKRLAEQAFLIDFLPEFAKLNQESRRPNYNNVFLMAHGHTDTIVNKLVYDPALQVMDMLRPSEISSLVPQIKLYKIVFAPPADALRGEAYEQEIPFYNYISKTDISAMTSPGIARGRGVGIQSFDWKLQGENPFTARRDIRAELKLYFQNIEELLREIQLPVEGLDTSKTFRYVDLVNHGIAERGRNFEWNPDFYRLKVQVGWEDPGNNNIFEGGEREREDKLRAIQNSKMVMFLTCVDHTIDITEEGAVNLTINYIAHQEASYIDKDSDVLADEQTRLRRLRRRRQISEDARSCDRDWLARVTREFNQQVRQENYDSWQRIIKKMYQQCDIYYVPVAPGDLESYINFGTTSVRGIRNLYGNQNSSSPTNNLDLSRGSEDIATMQDYSALESVLSRNGAVGEPDEILKQISDLSYEDNETGGKINLQFFYFGDLVKTALDLVSKTVPELPGASGHDGVIGKLDKQLRVLLGPISFSRINLSDEDVASEDLIYDINLADIPISLNYYIEWFLNTAVMRQKPMYPVLTFIRDLANKLLTGIMRDQSHSLENVSRQNLQLRSNFFTARADEGRDPLAVKRNAIRGAGGQFTRVDLDGAFRNAMVQDQLPLLQPPGPGEPSYHYMLLYAINTGTTQNLHGNAAEDRLRGIYHFAIGQDKGIFKRVTFEKSDMPGLREARYQQDMLANATGLFALANVYNISLSTVGNTMFVPGTKLYLNPAGLGGGLGSPAQRNSKARQLGIGGYHVVTKVDSYIEAGAFRTDIRAIFEAAGQRTTLGFPTANEEESEEQCAERVNARSLLPPVPTDPIRVGELSFDPETGEEIVTTESQQGDFVGDLYVTSPTESGGS